MTARVAFSRWWDEVGSHGNDPDIKRALDWLEGQIGPQTALHDITDAVVNDAVQARRKHVKKAGRDHNGKQLYKPLSARTVNKTVPSLLSRVMHRAKKVWNIIILLEPNWADHMLMQEKRPVREITPAEDAAIDSVESRDYADLRRFAEITGLRRRELLLTWRQVDFEKAEIRVKVKGGKWRTIPLSTDAYSILWARRGHHETSVFTFVAERTRKCPKSKKNFVKGKRYPMTYYGIGTNRRRKWAKAGVDARLHDTRHTTGMRTLRSTGNLKVVQRILGHTRITTTADFYTDANQDDMRQAMEATARSQESQIKSQIAAAESDKQLQQKEK